MTVTEPMMSACGLKNDCLWPKWLEKFDQGCQACSIICDPPSKANRVNINVKIRFTHVDPDVYWRSGKLWEEVFPCMRDIREFPFICSDQFSISRSGQAALRLLTAKGGNDPNRASEWKLQPPLGVQHNVNRNAAQITYKGLLDQGVMRGWLA
jgi:hypothetical protein